MKHGAVIVGVALSALGLGLVTVRVDAAGKDGGCNSVVPLEATDPGSAGDARAGDLVCLSRWIGNATIVGLGEGAHGTHTLHRLGHRIFQHLVENEGFEVFALEIDQAHAAILDEYVQGHLDVGDLDHLMAGGWWAQKIFYDEALKDLLRWMRSYNAIAGRSLHLAGFDAKQPRLAGERLSMVIGGVDPEASTELQVLLAQALAPGAFGVFPNVWGFTGTVRIARPEDNAKARALVEVAVRGEGVVHGYVGFSARAGTGKPSVVRWVPIEGLRPTGTIYSLELEVPALTDALEVTYFHRGNGTVWFERPVVQLGDQRIEVHGEFESVEPRPLMMPALQSMDYRVDLIEDEATGRPSLRIAADPLLDTSLEAARAVGRHIENLLRLTEPEDFPKAQADWARQLSRLVTQAVEWRVLAETNRDVFLAENLLWLHRTMFPGRRILALGHTSHTERRPAKMGAYVAEALGDAYRTVSMAAGSGSYRDLGEMSEITFDAPLELFKINPTQLSELETAVGRIHSGSYLFRSPDDPAAARTLVPALNAPSRFDVMIFVRGVEPLRRTP